MIDNLWNYVKHEFYHLFKRTVVVMLIVQNSSCTFIEKNIPAPVKPLLGIDVFDDSYQGNVAIGVKAYNDGDYYQALHELYVPAKSDDKLAQYYFGLMYARGKGVQQSEEKAREWLVRSAEQNYIDAMMALANFYHEGIFFEKDLDAAFSWTLKAAKEGSIEAQYIVGNAYLTGSMSEKIDYYDAHYWLLKAADKQHGAAENAVATTFYRGLGVTKDYESALRYLKRSVSRRVLAAKYNLALFYLDSETGYYKPAEAKALIEQAALAGYGPAVRNLERLRKELSAYENTIVLFGLPLSLATRKDVRKKLKQLGANLVVGAKSDWTDIYNAKKLIEESDRLSITYSIQENKIGEVRYRFPEMNNPEGVVELFNRLYKRYGRPVKKQKDFDIQGVYYQWNVKGVIINLAKGWPDDSLSVRYLVRDVYQLVKDEQRRRQDDENLLLPTSNVY